MTAVLKHALAPSAAPDARLLVLGSLPGDESIRQAQYYAHPSNVFWWLMSEVIARPLTGLPYADRLAALRGARIALWDVIERAERPGSLDAAITRAVPRDLAAFAASLPDLRAVAFNGGTAARAGRQQLRGVDGLTLIDLPSSSAAHAALSRDAKRALWLKLRALL